jgi:hypothetical protein
VGAFNIKIPKLDGIYSTSGFYTLSMQYPKGFRVVGRHEVGE